MQLLPNGKQTFFDGAGNPLANGKVYFYLPNTSTPATTYQDASGQTPNANPVILDGNGQAVIYGTGSYRQVVQDANGVTVWDQTTTAPDAGFIDLGNTANGKGADLVANATKKVASIAALRALRVPQGSDAQTVMVDGYAAGNDGGGGTFIWSSTATTADDGGAIIAPSTNPTSGRWLRLVDGHVNVLWFGAKGDGTTDDRAAIQAAVNSHSNVYFPPGYTFLVVNTSNRVNLNSGNRLFGGGVIKRSDDQWSIFEAIGTISAHISNITVDGLTFEGTDFAGGSDKGTAGIRATFIDGLTVTRCTASNIGLVSVGVYPESGTTSMLSIGTAGSGGTYDSLTASNISSDVIVTDNKITNTTAHTSNYWTILFVGVKQFNVSNNVWDGPNAGALFDGGINDNGSYITDLTKLKCFNGIFSNNVINGQRPGIMVWNCHDIVIADNQFNGHNTEPLDVEACNGILVTGNKIRGTQFGLAIYYDCDNLEYYNNDIALDLSGGTNPNPFLISSTGSNFGKCIVKRNKFVGENYTVNSATRVAAVEIYACDHLEFDNNHLDQVIVIDFGGHAYLSYSGNTVIIDGGYPTTYNGAGHHIIDVSGSGLLTKSTIGNPATFNFNDNKFLSRNSTVSNYVFLSGGASSVACVYNIKRNIVEGISSMFDFNPTNVTNINNSAKLHSIVVQNNQMQTTSYPTYQGASTSSQATILWVDNYNGTGGDFYNTPPGSFYSSTMFSVGSRIWNTSAVAAGTPGWVCTAQGQPGTWKAMANLAA